MIMYRVNVLFVFLFLTIRTLADGPVPAEESFVSPLPSYCYSDYWEDALPEDVSSVLASLTQKDFPVETGMLGTAGCDESIFGETLYELAIRFNASFDTLVYLENLQEKIRVVPAFCYDKWWGDSDVSRKVEMVIEDRGREWASIEPPCIYKGLPLDHYPSFVHKAIAMAPMINDSNEARLMAEYLANIHEENSENIRERELKDGGLYFGIAVGGTGPLASFRQHGHNEDTVCYPNDICLGEGVPSPVEGYHWFYDLDAGTGSSGDLFVGYDFGRVRGEVATGFNSYGRMIQDFDYIVRVINPNYVPDIEMGHDLAEYHPTTSIGNLTTTTLWADGYFELLPNNERPCCCAFFGSMGWEDPFPESVILVFPVLTRPRKVLQRFMTHRCHFTMAIGMLLCLDGTLPRVFMSVLTLKPKGHSSLGLKLTFSGFGEFSDRDGYAVHPMHSIVDAENFLATETISGMRAWNTQITVKWK